jgi:hypothetical protein
MSNFQANQPTLEESQSSEIVLDMSDEDVFLTPIHSQAAARLNLPSEQNPPQTPRRCRTTQTHQEHSDSSDDGPPSPSPRPTPRSSLNNGNTFGFGVHARTSAVTPHRGRMSAFASPHFRINPRINSGVNSGVTSSRCTPRRLFDDLTSMPIRPQELSQSLQQVQQDRDSSPEFLPAASFDNVQFVTLFDSSELGHQLSELDEPLPQSQLSQSCVNPDDSEASTECAEDDRQPPTPFRPVVERLQPKRRHDLVTPDSMPSTKKQRGESATPAKEYGVKVDDLRQLVKSATQLTPAASPSQV